MRGFCADFVADFLSVGSNWVSQKPFWRCADFVADFVADFCCTECFEWNGPFWVHRKIHVKIHAPQDCLPEFVFHSPFRLSESRVSVAQKNPRQNPRTPRLLARVCCSSLPPLPFPMHHCHTLSFVFILMCGSPLGSSRAQEHSSSVHSSNGSSQSDSVRG